MPKHRYLIISLLLSFTFALNASAMDLKEAIQKAYNKSYTIKAQQEDNKSARANLTASYLKLMPSVNANLQKQNLSKGDPYYASNKNDSFAKSLTVSQNLFSGGQNYFAIKQTHKQNKQSDVKTKGTISNTIYQAAVAYINYLLAEETKKQTDIQEETLHKIFESTELKFSLGEVTSTDVSQAKAKLSAAITQTHSAISNLENAKTHFTTIIGEAPVNLKKIDFEVAIPSSLTEALDIAKAHNFDLINQKLNAEIAKQSLNITYARLLPSVDLNSTLSKSTSSKISVNRYNQITSVSMSVPIFNQGIEYTNIANAQYQYSKQKFALQDQVDNSMDSVQQAWTNYHLTGAKIQSARDAVNSAELAFHGVQEEAKMGLKTNIDVLNAEQDLYQYRVDLLNSEYNRIISGIKLIMLMGKLDMDFVNNNKI